MTKLTPGQKGESAGADWARLPPVDGPKWTSDRLTISREWVACRKGSKSPWKVIPYAAIASVRPASGGIAVARDGGEAVVIGKAVLGSLEACGLLVAGMSTNPAVAPAAGELLQPRLEAARRKRQAWLARRHSVNRSGTTHTFRLHRGHVVFGVVLAAGFLVLGVAGLFCPGHPAGWRLLVLLGGCLAGGALSAWIGVRFSRLGVQISGGNLTVRNWLSSYTVSSSEIRAITLRPKASGKKGSRWVPCVELADGRSGWIDALGSGPAETPPQPEPAAILEEVRALLGVRAEAISPPEMGPDLLNGEQPQDILPGRPQADEPVRGAPGLPGLDGSARGLASLLAFTCLACGVVSVTSVVVAGRFASPGLSNYLAWLGGLWGILPGLLDDPSWRHQLGWVGRGMLWAGKVLGFIGIIGWSSAICPDCAV